MGHYAGELGLRDDGTDNKPRKKQVFAIEGHDGVDKSFKINGPDGFDLTVDYDDVDHRTQDKLAKKVVKILNEHWEDA